MPRLAILLPTLLLATALAGTVEAKRKRTLMGRPADAIEVFRCGFDDDNWDTNYDKWPDRWTRESSPDYPHYVGVEIEPEGAKATDTGRQLTIRLDGAQAMVKSPPIRVMTKFSYFLEMKLKLVEVKHSKVSVQLEYQNPDGKVRQAFRAHPVKRDGEWVTIEIGPCRPKHEDVDRAVIRIETERGRHGDLNGEVSVADLWLGRLPSLDVSANNPFHVYTDPRDVVITCSLSGIRERDPEIRFQLLDATSEDIGSMHSERLPGREIHDDQKLIRQESRRASDIVDGVGNHAVGYEGETQWRPEIHKHGGYGFYQVRVEMLSSETGEPMDNRRVTLAIIPPRPASLKKTRGEFGWTLPRADSPLDFAMLEKVLPLVGVNWIKMPITFDIDDPGRGEEIIQFAERIAAHDIEAIGIIQHPLLLEHQELEPDDLPTSYAVATVFGGAPERWLPLYDHIMTRLSLRIRWWQLGSDHDTSFVGYDDLIEQITNIRRHLYRFGQDVGLGIGWRWDTELPQEQLSWEFFQMAAEPPLSSVELDERLSELSGNPGTRWVLIEPAANDPTLKTERAQHVARVRELVKQIVIAKRHGADGVFVPNPFSGSHGLMTAEGKPGELLLPWRTSATLLGGAEYLGQLQLPSLSKNWLFRREDGEVVMVLWNDEEASETLYLGEDIRIIDVWGKERRPSMDGRRQVVPVGPMPRFVVGLHEAIARWRMSVQFEQIRIPSIFGQDQPNGLLLTNGFRQGVGGAISLFVPNLLRPGDRSKEWTISMPSDDFGVATASAHRIPLEINLNDAAIGRQPVRIDFQVEADRAEDRYEFSVWRSLEVGLGQVTMNVRSEIDEKGRLLVHQQMTNSSGRPMSFKCFLYAQGRRRKRAQVFELGPELDVKTYSYSRGEELLGKEVTLRAEEIDGPRVLIQRFVAKAHSKAPAAEPAD